MMMSDYTPKVTEIVSALEADETTPTFNGKYLVIRMDGRGFSKFTSGLRKPFDVRFSRLMIRTAEYMVHKYSAVLAYTQSDEITLVLKKPEEGCHIFGGRKQKIVSVLAANASVYFAREIYAKALGDDVPDNCPHFDCRCWATDDPELVRMALLSRGLDGKRNSIQMAAGAVFSHRALQCKSTEEMREMLRAHMKGGWEAYPVFFKHGTFVERAPHTPGVRNEHKSFFFHFVPCTIDYLNVPAGDCDIENLQPSIRCSTLGSWESAV